jgi:hypothetical protein
MKIAMVIFIIWKINVDTIGVIVVVRNKAFLAISRIASLISDAKANAIF